MSRPHIESQYGAFIIGSRRDPDTGERGELIQTDWDYPATAERMGWNMRRLQRRDGETVTLKRAPNRGKGCYHGSTDGTVDCPDCGVTASEFIGAAGEFLSSLC